MSRKCKLLIDECLHISLVSVANNLGYEAHHVTYLGRSGLKDHELMPKIRESEYTFVTNNAVDFRKLFQTEPLNSGLIILVPNLKPELQRELFKAALEHVGTRDLTNTAIEIDKPKKKIEIEEYEIPTPRP